MKKFSRKRVIGLAILAIPFFFWMASISNASNAHFLEDQWAVQVMVLGGAISMVAGAISFLWE